MKRFARLSNGFSEEVENHEHMLALHYMYCNFARIYQSLCVTPAMEAGASDHVWSIDEIIALLNPVTALRRFPKSESVPRPCVIHRRFVK
jgi:hypothetical protein